MILNTVLNVFMLLRSTTSLSEAETVDVDPSAATALPRSNPVNMPAARPLVPVFIDSGSASKCTHYAELIPPPHLNCGRGRVLRK